MDFIQSYIPEEIIYALGWTVVHSLWQGMLVALVMALVLMGLQHKSAKLRYELSGLSLFTIFVLALVTFILKYDAAQSQPIVEILVTPGWENAVVVTAEANHSLGNFMVSWADYFNQNLPLIVTVWLMGVAFFLLRLMGGYAYVQRLRYSNNQVMSPYWRHKLKKLSRRLPLKRSVALVESALVKVPMVIGYLKPAILLPIGIVNVLSEEEIEAILAHELAHIHRNDYLLNIVLSFVEVLFYYHPAVWWLAANVRAERENCCDDIGVQLCGNSLTYAKALVSIQEMHRSAPAFALSFSGRRKNQLLNRVKRILNQPQNKSNIMEKLAATTLLFLSIIFLSMSAGNSTNQTTSIEKKQKPVDLVLMTEAAVTPTVMSLTTTDTIPGKAPRSKSTQTIVRTDDDQSVEMKIVDGEITKLKVNGKVIPKEEYDDYTDLQEELLEDMPPASPAPPVPPVMATPPAPEAPPAPPAPPAPETPKALPGSGSGSQSSVWFKKKNQKTVTTEKGDDGRTTIIIESEGQEEPIHIVVDGDQDYIIVDDAELQIGDTAIIIDEYDFPMNGFNDFKLKSSGENFFVFPEGQKSDFDFYVLDSDRFPAQRFELKGFSETDNAKIEDLRLYLADSQSEARDLVEQYQREIEAIQKIEIEKQQELATIHRADAKRQQEIAQQFQEEAKARQEEIQRVMKEYREQQQNLIRERQHLSYNKDISYILEDELLNDGLIDDRNSYSMSLTPKKLKINGKRQPDNILKKYKELYEKHTGLQSGKNGNSKSNYHIHISK